MKAAELISLIDHTRLEEQDSADAVGQFCKQAINPLGNCAAICVYPQYILIAKEALKNSSIKIASVANFPQGGRDFSACLKEMQFIIHQGADEIDIVLPYEELMRGNNFFVLEFLKACRRYSENKTLKIIIESGLLNPEQIKQACEMIIAAEIEFIKTSTGKVKIGATPEAVKIILETIKNSKAETGLKISGGVRTVEDAENYITLIENIMGKNWISPEKFRLGSSKLLNSTLEQAE